MHRDFVATIIGALSAVALLGPIGHAWPARPPVVATVQVRNDAVVVADVLFDARADVTRLYRQAGVELVWGSANADFAIVLSGDRDACARGASPYTMGQAVINTTTRKGRLAYVYYDRIADLARVAGVDTSNILGHVMAHEMAHLFGLSHTTRGLMRAGWDDHELLMASQGLLRFSAAESETLRATIASANHQ